MKKLLLSGLLWWVANLATAQNLYLNQAGDVGIGTRNPGARLDVSTTGENAMRIIGVNPYLLFRDVYDASPREAGFLRAWTTDPFNPAGYHGLEIGVPSQSPGQLRKHLMFSANNAIRMTILDNGNVGINTTNPTYKLDVAGNMRVTGYNNRIEGYTNIVGTTLFEGTAFNGIVTILGSAANALVNIENTDTGSTGAAISVTGRDAYGTIRARNTRFGAGILATTAEGQYSGQFEGGRILVAGSNNGFRSGGIEFKNTNSFGSNSLGYVGMNGDNEIGFFGYGLNDWLLRLNVGTGTICSRSTIALCSDQRLKRDFQPLTGSLTKLASVQGQHYFWNEAKMPGLQTGFVAQEIQAIFPELVQTDERGFLSVNYTGFIPHLVEAVKELKATANQTTQRLTAENQALQAKVEQVMKRLTALESHLPTNQIATTKK